ncbi:Purine efflux pump PbuE [Paenibacillus solanacearum]|uniref:Purine efflux pump PbuE n=1 Tax=Paenibacillus solanacearum TaxID=2048548 RepID=A0A916K038_9BACL|nr:MFS transporter [Paenibacillus solanacearum]CAG7619228.1 Purine efflux pump PbuE [Paenibacillus solanacearum]
MGSRGSIVLAVAWITLFLIGTDLFVISPLLPFISQTYQVDAAAAGWMVTAFSITYAVSAPLLGRLSDRRGRGGLIVCGLGLFALANALTAYAPTYGWLIASRVLAGLAVASVTPLIYAAIGDMAPSHRKGTWLSIVVSGHLTSLWIGAPLGSFLEQEIGWRPIFGLMAVAGAILAAAHMKLWGAAASAAEQQSRLSQHGGSVVASVGVTFLWAVSMYALYVYLGEALYSELGVSPSEIALSVTFYGIGAVFGNLISGQLTDKFGVMRISNAALLLLAAALIALGFAFSAGDWVYFFLFMWALTGYAAFSSYQARLAAQYPQQRGTAMAWNNTALYAGITAGSLAGGYAISAFDAFTLPFLCGGVALAAYGVSVLLSRMRK